MTVLSGQTWSPLQLWRARTLLAVLVRRELQSRNPGTAFGLLWLYLPPTVTLLVYYFVFGGFAAARIAAGGPLEPPFGAYLVVGMLPWLAFSDALGRAASSLTDAGALLQKNPLPPELFPARTVLASCVVYAPLILVAIPLIAPAAGLRWSSLALLPLYGAALLVLLALAQIVALLVAALRDVQQVLGLALGVGVFVSPVLFPLSFFSGPWQWLPWLNPATPTVLGTQAVLLSGQWPPFGVWMAQALWLVIVLPVAAVLSRRAREQLIDWL